MQKYRQKNNIFKIVIALDLVQKFLNDKNHKRTFLENKSKSKYIHLNHRLGANI